LATVRGALSAVDAGALVGRALASPDIERAMRSTTAVDVVAVGKAAGPMLRAALSGKVGIPLRHAVGVSVLAPAELSIGVQWHTTSHPVPDARSVAAARAVLDVAGAADSGDLLLLLLSGGASALMALPAEGVSLEDKQRTCERLLREGAEIHALNTVRKHLSAIKGGQLAAAAGGSVLTLAVSDVVGDDVSVIGSGPSVADATTFADALMQLDRYGGQSGYPEAVVRRLTVGASGAIPETPQIGDPRIARSDVQVIGNSRSAVGGASFVARALGYVVHVIEEPIVGEARLASRGLVEVAARMAEVPGPPLCILAAGETTVRVTGTGKGGRNQECALAMARGLAVLGTVAVAASIGTDGVDGPTDAAGGVVDSTTVTRAVAAGFGSPEDYLADNNSYVLLDGLGDLIRTGPTDTNVGDLQIILVGGRTEG
jgi:glycerate 2-kinase